MTRILVTGSRGWTDAAAVSNALWSFIATEGLTDGEGNIDRPLTVVHGGCPRGADAMARDWCVANDVQQEVHNPDWKHHGRAGGPLRNQAMVNAGAAVCLAFVKDGSAGATG